jgi:cytoplasmic iron level regulating protein YaaA (DUF328/UPF0246 family)
VITERRGPIQVDQPKHAENTLMLAVISPAKRLDFSTPWRVPRTTLPAFPRESQELIGVLRNKSPAALSRLMGLSSKLADLNYERYASWHEDAAALPKDEAKPAALAFKGDVYLGLDAETMSGRDLAWAQKHLRILSGLHGLLKPLDLIQPYRLEMGTALETRRGKNLYEFWGDKITDALNEALEAQRQKVLVNLASNEYFEAVQDNRIEARIITPVFKDLKNGSYKVLSFYAKRARGLMARHIIDQRASTLKALQAFNAEGYYFSEEQSRGDSWVFLRDSLPS